MMIAKKIDTYLKCDLIISLAFGRLLFSSDMWLRPEYWFAFSMLFAYPNKKFY